MALSSSGLDAALKSSSSLPWGRSRGALFTVASSTARWKLEPPKPKLLTPARRGWSLPRTQGRASVFR